MNQYKDVLTELYEKLNKMEMKDPYFDVIVHSIQEIQFLRSTLQTYERSRNTYEKELTKK